MINMTKLTAAFVACAVLAGCGGGSTGGNDDTPAFGRADPKIEFFPQKPSLLSNRSGFPVDLQAPYFTQVNFKITDDNGFPAPGTTIVDLQISNGSILSLEPGNPFATNGCTGTSSSIATYFFASGPQAGTAQITASVTAPLKSGKIDQQTHICTTEFQTGARDVRKIFDYTVNVGPEPFVRLAAVPGRTTLPVNTFDVVATPGSAFLTPVEVTQKTAFGALVTGRNITVTVARPDIIQLSLADNPGTPTVNELNIKTALVTPEVIAGKALFYVHSRQRAGTAVVKIVGTEGVAPNESSFSIDLNITVGSAPGLITQAIITSDTRSVYVANSNANTVLPLQIRATDEAGEGVADASAGVNNVLLDIVNPNGETLIATNAAGTAVQGTSIRIRTSQSIASAVFRAAARQGLVQIRATLDSSDNNVDNGVQAPVSATKSVTVSDGKLFDLTLTSPVVGLIDNTVKVTGFNPTTQSNGTYSTILSVVATDRQGNPALPNTAIEFGLIDSPTVGYPTQGSGQFVITGNDGDPAEGGFNFLAPGGAFTTAGGGAGPGDTLIIFGGDFGPNRDMESARIISRVNGPTSLDIASTTRFTLNDDTGVSVNRGPVLPYAIGRASIGTITNTALTNDKGVATTTVNYPVSRIGHTYIAWARGAGDTPTGQTTAELVSDVEVTRFGAALDFTIIASPSTITSGRTTNVQICVRDQYQNYVPSAFIRYGFDKASGTVDGGTDGVVRTATDQFGCTIAAVRAFLAAGTGGAVVDGSILFSVVGALAPAPVKITAASGTVLFAIPEQLGGNGGQVTLRLLDASGDPITGVQIGGSCTTGQAGLAIPPGRTDAFGETTATISASLNGPNAAGTASCVFTALGATATVKLQGVNTCNLGFSPPPAGCPVTPPVVLPSTTLTVNLQKADGNAYVALTGPQVQVIGNAGGINCVSTSTTNCIGTSIPNGTVVSLTASTGINGLPNAASFCRWTGAPGCFGMQPTVQVNMTGNLTCVAVFSETGPAGCPTF